MKDLKLLQEAYFQVFLSEARASDSELAKTIKYLENEIF